MRAAGKRTNAFAALREESAILKQKAKKERALERRARKEADAEQRASAAPVVAQVVVPVAVQTGLSWADIYDDDDEEEHEAMEKPVEDLDAYLSSSTEEDEGEEEDEIGERQLSDNAEPVKSENKVTEPSHENGQEQPVKILSKKEKTKKELDELEALLSNLGLKTDAEKDEKPSDTATAGEGDLPAAQTSTKSKKKKKKPNAAETTEDERGIQEKVVEEEDEEDEEPGAAVTRDEALANLRKAAARKKKTGSSVPATVLAEAKKKAEAKKAKQKRDKHMYDR